MVSIIVPSTMPDGAFQVFGGTGGAGVTFSLTYTDSRDDTTGVPTITYNFGGDPSCGVADPNRIVVVIMGRRMAGAAPTSVTIAGVSATQVSGAFNAGGSVQQSDIWYAAVPTGTTCSVVVAWDSTGSAFSDSGIGVYRLITATPTPTASATTSTNTSNTVSLPAYTVPTGGASVNGWSQRDSTGSNAMLWTNTSAAGGDYYRQPSFRGYAGSTVQVAGSVTVSAVSTPAGGADWISMSAAAWGP